MTQPPSNPGQDPSQPAQHQGQPAQNYGQPAPNYAQPAGQGGYGSPQAGPGQKPKSIDLAVKVMYVGAALALLNIVFQYFASEQLSSELGAGVGTSIGTLAIGAVIQAGLWILVAQLAANGKGAAKVLGLIFFIIGVLSLLAQFIAFTLLGFLGIFLTVAAGAVAVYFLFQKDSTAWFQAHKGAPRG